MQANEFIKKFGWEEAKRVLSGAPSDATSFRFCGDSCALGLYGRTESISKNQVSLINLKRLVESKAWVDEHGTIERAKEYANSPYTAPEIKERLLQAIADVESCQ